MEAKPKRPGFNSQRGSQAQLVRAPDYVRHFQNVRHWSMEVKPKRPRFNSRRGSQAQLVRAPDYVRHFQNVRHLQWRSSLSSAMSIFSKVNNNLLTEHWLCAGQASHEHKLVWYFTIILALFIQNSLYWYDGQWPSYDVNMVFHHTFGTIHLKQLVLVWWSVAKLWREYGISPSSWHHSTKTA